MVESFSLGSKVCSKYTGFPGYGKIVGILTSEIYIKMSPSQSYSRWNELFPTWKDKPVYIVEFDEPVKSLTWEEYYKHSKNPTKEEYDNIPFYKVVAYPFEDLEIMK